MPDRLEQQLRETDAGFRARRDPAHQRVYDRAIADLMREGMPEGALRQGEMAPDFALPNATGREVQLYGLLDRGPVVVSFYRGGWCPYCNLALRALQAALPEIRAAGAELVAISPDRPDDSLATVEKNALGFEVLSDFDNRVARLFGLSYELPVDLAEIYRSRGIALDRRHGTDIYELPLPATYVLDRDGIARYAFVDADYTRRAEPADILIALRTLG